MTKTRKDFPVGTRCRLKTSRHQYASTSINGLYVNLGATPYITGIIHKEAPGYYHDMAAFRPDGWPLPEHTWPDGFMALISYLEPIDQNIPSTPCILSTGTGKPVPPAEVIRLVNEYLKGK